MEDDFIKTNILNLLSGLKKKLIIYIYFLH